MRILQGNSQLAHTHGRISHTREGDDDATTWRSKDEGKKELGSLGFSFFFFFFAGNGQSLQRSQPF
jgi:hypothetical protein